MIHGDVPCSTTVLAPWKLSRRLEEESWPRDRSKGLKRGVCQEEATTWSQRASSRSRSLGPDQGPRGRWEAAALQGSPRKRSGLHGIEDDAPLDIATSALEHGRLDRPH